MRRVDGLAGRRIPRRARKSINGQACHGLEGLIYLTSRNITFSSMSSMPAEALTIFVSAVLITLSWKLKAFAYVIPSTAPAKGAPHLEKFRRPRSELGHNYAFPEGKVAPRAHPSKSAAHNWSSQRSLKTLASRNRLAKTRSRRS